MDAQPLATRMQPPTPQPTRPTPQRLHRHPNHPPSGQAQAALAWQSIAAAQTSHHCSPSALPQPPQPAEGPLPAAASAAASPVQSPPPMLRCLTTCRDVQFVLMRLLQLEDLAALDSACRSWRGWLRRPPLGDGLHFEREGTLLQLEPLATCGWARRLVTEIITSLEKRDGHLMLLPGPSNESDERTACGRLLDLLPRFSRLHKLRIRMCEAFIPPQQAWPICFSSLAGSLRWLVLLPHGEQQAAQANSALTHVNLLRQLERLGIDVSSPQDARQADLSQLPLLPRLNTLLLRAENEREQPLCFSCTPEQVQCLAQCRQLTSLKYGSWSPDRREVDDDGWQLPPVEQQIAEGIATLVRGLTSAGRSEAASSASAGAGAWCVLQSLHLNCTFMSAAVWEHVSRLTSLTELCPVCWRSDLSPQQWARLADFTQLRSIRIATHPDDAHPDAPLRTEQFLPPMLQCTQLTSVRLRGASLDLSLSAAQLDGLARLPLLRVLELTQVEVESVAPLIHAVKLTTLVLRFCSGPPAVVDFRSSLPPLPLLARLSIYDDSRLTAAQAARLKAALFARMPKLTPEHFTQRLLGE